MFAKSVGRISAQFRPALSFKFDIMHYFSVDVYISLGQFQQIFGCVVLSFLKCRQAKLIHCQ